MTHRRLASVEVTPPSLQVVDIVGGKTDFLGYFGREVIRIQAPSLGGRADRTTYDSSFAVPVAVVHL